MTAVICWSMKTRTVANKAGTMATKHNHHGFDPRGWISQPRPLQVGWNSLGTVNFGVSTPKIMSMMVMEPMAMITPKSEMKPRTLAEKRFWQKNVFKT